MSLKKALAMTRSENQSAQLAAAMMSRSIFISLTANSQTSGSNARTADSNRIPADPNTQKIKATAPNKDLVAMEPRCICSKANYLIATQ